MEDEREFKILDPVELIRKAEIRLCGQRAFCYELIISELFGRIPSAIFGRRIGPRIRL
jgi:hypothetical protein